MSVVSNRTQNHSQNRSTNLAAELAQVERAWDPRLVARLNDYEAKVVRLAGEFVWHAHPDTDELFLVLSGRLVIAMDPQDGGDVALGPGELFVVPRGVRHRPQVLDGEATALLVEPGGVVNTGDAPAGDLTREPARPTVRPTAGTRR